MSPDQVSSSSDDDIFLELCEISKDQCPGGIGFYSVR